MTAFSTVRALIMASLVALTFALASPAIDHANAEPTGGGKVTCAGGGEPGDVVTRHVYTYVNGTIVAQAISSSICGNDGKWHQVAASVATGIALSSVRLSLTLR
jgi:hypothetical protein